MRDFVVHWHRSTRSFHVCRRTGAEVARVDDLAEAWEICEAEQRAIDGARANTEARRQQQRLERAARLRRGATAARSVR